MTIIWPNGLDIPSIHVEAVGRAFGVVQGQEDPDETPQETLARLEDTMLNDLKRRVIQMRKREIAQAQTNTEGYLTEN